jgi:hypothetical protein
VAAIFLERLLVLVLGILLTLGIAIVLLRPVVKSWRTTKTAGSEPVEGPR